MKSTLAAISLIIALGVFSTSSVTAQTLVPAGSYSGPCVTISRTLSYGTSGAQVTALQKFLVAQNFPGGGTWMETGYYGAATEAAVKDFQEQENLPQTGIV